MSQTLWLKKVWIPFWVIDIAISITLLCMSAVNSYINQQGTVYIQEANGKGHEIASSEFTTPDIWAFITIGFSVITLALTITEIVLFAKSKLGPVIPVIFNSFTTLMWLYLSAQTITNSALDIPSSVFWPIVLVLFVSALGKLIYSGVIFDRVRKGQYLARKSGVAAEKSVDAADENPAPEAVALDSANPFNDPSRQGSPAPSCRKPEHDAEKFVPVEDEKAKFLF